MKITFFIYNLQNSGGMERMATLIAGELKKRGHTISFICLDQCNHSFFHLAPEIPIHNLKQHTNRIFKFVSNIRSLRKILSTNSPDLLLNVGTGVILRSLPASIGLGHKIASWEHRDIRIGYRSGSFLSRWLISHFTHAHILLTETDVRFAQKQFGEKRAYCIPNPVTLPNHPNPSSLNNKIALCVGRITREKGYDLLLKVWSHVHKKHPDWCLHVVGSLDEVRVKDDIERTRNELELGQSVQFFPPTKDIVSYYQNASIYILPSRTECLPLVSIEAKTIGLPIVSFLWGDNCKELIQDGENGYVIADFSVENMSQQITKLIESPELRLRLGKASLESSRVFEIESVMLRWDSLLSSLKGR